MRKETTRSSLEEDKKPVKTESLKAFVRRLDVMSTYLNELAAVVAVMQYFDGQLYEGSIEQRKHANKLIEELIKLLSELDNVKLYVSNDVNLSISEKQRELTHAKGTVNSLHDRMLALWELRNTGRTRKDNDIIRGTTLKLFASIVKGIKDLQKYVNDFNEVSLIKLKFNVKWTALPK